MVRMARAWSVPGTRIAIGAAVVSLVAILGSQPTPREQVGPLPGGGFRLNSGWVLDPVGKQVPLDTLPMSTALSPDGKYLLVLNGGYRPPSITVIDAASSAVTGRVPVADAWLGLTFTPRGDRVYVGGGSKASVFEFTFANGKLTPARTFVVPSADKVSGHEMIGDVALSPDGRMLYAADLYHDSVAVLNPQSGMVIDRIKTGRRPYRILFHPNGKSFFVTSWADGTLGQYDASSGSQLARVPLGAHPTDILWRNGAPTDADPGAAPYTARLFVAAANTNSVYSVAVNSANDLSVVERINISMTPRQPLGMTPSALALSPDGKRLFVACSDGNVAAVVDVSSASSRVEGFIPTGWYPPKLGGTIGAETGDIFGGADRLFNFWAFSGGEVERQAHDFEGQKQVGKDDSRVDFEDFSGFDGGPGPRPWAFCRFRSASIACGRHDTRGHHESSLAHRPDGSAFGGLGLGVTTIVAADAAQVTFWRLHGLVWKLQAVVREPPGAAPCLAPERATRPHGRIPRQLEERRVHVLHGAGKTVREEDPAFVRQLHGALQEPSRFPDQHGVPHASARCRTLAACPRHCGRVPET